MDLLKQMMISVKTNSRETFTATPSEQAAIKSVVEHAAVLEPKVQVRYVQRQEDSLGTLIVIGLIARNLNAEGKEQLYTIPHSLDLPEGLSVTVSPVDIDDYPSSYGQLLDVKPFLKDHTTHLIQPKIVEVQWHNPYKRGFTHVLTFGLGLWLGHLMFNALVPYSNLSLRAIRMHITESIKNCDRQIAALKNSSPADPKIIKYQNEKALLEKADTVLHEKK